MVPGSFYGKKTAVYLTPLERKAIKECVPPPPLPSLPTQKLTGKKKKQLVKGSKKPGKVAAEPKKTGKKLAVQPFSTVARTIKLSKMNRFAFESSPCQIGRHCWQIGIGNCLRFACDCPPLFLLFELTPITHLRRSSVTAKPAAPSGSGSAKSAESKRAITVSFSSLKPKPKIFVGAAFFSTGKSRMSMFKKPSSKSATRPTAAAVTAQPAPPRTSENTKPLPRAAVTNLRQKPPTQVRMKHKTYSFKGPT